MKFGIKKLAIAAATAVGSAALWAAPVIANNDTWIPPEYVGYCEEIGAQTHICPELLEAVIEMESSGQPGAQNCGCYGLMQINKAYHTERMARLGVSDLYDPYSNIKMGADILLELYETYGDNTQEILMRYNGVVDAAARAKRLDFTYYAAHGVERARELEIAHGKVAQ